jgi:SAM-dependent methyltransferase
MKRLLKKILPLWLIHLLMKLFPPKPFLHDIAENERIVEYFWAFRNLPTFGKILDVGCHGSMFSKAMASAGYKVYGLDRKKVSIDHPDFVFQQGDVLDIEGGQFDAVTCISTLEHIPDDKQALANMMKILKPGGFLLLTVPCGKPKRTKEYKVFCPGTFDKEEYYKSIKPGVWVRCFKSDMDIYMEDKDYVKGILCATIYK